MDETLFPYYERELVFIRQLLQEFTRNYPSAANRLLLEPNRSADPQVERLIESFALLAGRVQHKLDDEFPEITTALLQALYPHFLAPIPSLGILQFDLDAARAQLPNGFTIARHSPLHTEAVDGVPCKFRTAYPVTLWPIRLTNAVFQGPPFPRGLTPPAGAAAALRLQFECLGASNLLELSLERLRLYLNCDLQVLPPLYELLFNHALQVVFRPVEPDTSPAPLVLNPGTCLGPVGFDAAEGLLPYAPPSRLGYRLLTELFVFPAKFWFVDLGGWELARRRGFQRRCEVAIFFERTATILEKSIDAAAFRLGCTPVVNLFPHAAEPIRTQPGVSEFRVLPDATQPRAMEVYSIESVKSTNLADATTQEFPPLFSIRHPHRPDQQDVFWHMSRWSSLAERDSGTNVQLHLVDLDFEPWSPTGTTLELATMCTNRDLPNELRAAGDRVRFELEAAAPLAGIRCLAPLTTPLRPKPRRGRLWQLISHLSLNYLSLVKEGQGRTALQEILGLYDFSDPEAGQQQLAAVTRQFTDGIASVSSRRVIGRLTREGVSSFCRGVEVAVAFDDDKYPGIGVYLFAAVLERFFGLYVSNNSFTQLAAKRTKDKQNFKVWPPRPGELQSL
ncbi:MAG: type VI secretion system baseplate subunit TssF [Gemmataceae bacterium]|nr:type VI secretion system baseplate subunit TssF [Gemmataceae bacterium]MCI0742338.1 type VI secretion system baseplate subunit TssF [Gemmataceae bacterium]